MKTNEINRELNQSFTSSELLQQYCDALREIENMRIKDSEVIRFTDNEKSILKTLVLQHSINISKQQKTLESATMKIEAENLFKKLSQ